MSTVKQKIPHAAALSLARRIVCELAPGCAKIEIAGSIRRGAAMVGDIEIVAIPELEVVPVDQPALFADGARPEAFRSLLDMAIGRLLAEKPNFTQGDKDGEKYKNFFVNGEIKIDLFITTRPQWGVIFAIRTGSAAFSKRIVTQRAAGGSLPAGYEVSGGWLYYQGDRVPMPDEREFFEDVLGGWVEPKDRK